MQCWREGSTRVRFLIKVGLVGDGEGLACDQRHLQALLLGRVWDLQQRLPKADIQSVIIITITTHYAQYQFSSCEE
jgi:hypothetical protein